jgi:hypothetical protein
MSVGFSSLRVEGLSFRDLHIHPTTTEGRQTDRHRQTHRHTDLHIHLSSAQVARNAQEGLGGI